MIYSINFMDMAGKINSLAFAKYLKETGWKQYTTKREDIKIFQLNGDDKLEQITIPMQKELRDYNQAMYDAVAILAHVENKSVEQVMLYLLNPNTDIIKIRLAKAGMESGNILFDDAIKLYDNAKKLLAATAQDIINPKKYHTGRPEEVVQKFLSSCRFGQTEIGSYVVSVVCPFAELSKTEGYQQLSIFSDEETCANSMTRKVTYKLMENIYNIKTKIDNGEDDLLYSDKEEYKISANFYEALNGLNLESDNVKLEFKADWSPVVKCNRFEVSEIELSNDYYQPIKSIIGKLKEEQEKFKEIVGRIKKLEALPIVDKRTTGNVTISYIDDDNRSHTITTRLEKYDYDKAIEAHQAGKYIKVIGMVNESKRNTMECESFSIVE